MRAYGKRFSISTGEERHQKAHIDRSRPSLKMDKTWKAAPAEEASFFLKLLLLEDQKANKKYKKWFFVRQLFQAR